MATQLGRYTLEKKIGSGGMADVWLAQGPNGVCVLKCPFPHLCGNPDFVRMFLDEATLLAQLHHPGIAQISDLGHVDGVYYLAMEYVPGFDMMTISLEHERHGELMAPELCARIVADAAEALHYAHEAKSSHGKPLNIVHRDVTPHNILLSRQGLVKLIDFGVAKTSIAHHRTQAGLVKGKYAYMAPEQIAGGVVDRRVDVYALGLVLYELLTNVRAIPGNTEVEQIESARSGRIRPIEQLRPNVPVPLRQILGGCLHQAVEGRYPTAQAVREDLEKFLSLQRQVLGQDDLLRLFRGVAADVGDLSFSARPTEEDQPVSEAGVVVLPDNALATGKVDELGYSSTLPSMESSSATRPVVVSNTRQIDRVSAPRVAPHRGPIMLIAMVTALLVVSGWWWWWSSRPHAAEHLADGLLIVFDAGANSEPIAAFEFPPQDSGERVPANSPADEVTVRAALVSVTSVVEGDVFVDGKKYGRTPQELELMPGPHTIWVRNAASGLDKKVVWTLEPGETKTLTVAAPSPFQKKGKLKVYAPPFCALSIDGKAKSERPSSIWEVEISEGSHQVSCTLRDASLPQPRVKTQSVVIRVGEETNVEFNMAVD